MRKQPNDNFKKFVCILALLYQPLYDLTNPTVCNLKLILALMNALGCNLISVLALTNSLGLNLYQFLVLYRARPRSNHLVSSSTILARIMQARSHNLGRTFLYFLLILQDVHAKCPFSCISCKKIVKILQATLARKLARFLFLARNLARSLLSCKKFCKV